MVVLLGQTQSSRRFLAERILLDVRNKSPARPFAPNHSLVPETRIRKKNLRNPETVLKNAEFPASFRAYGDFLLASDWSIARQNFVMRTVVYRLRKFFPEATGMGTVFPPRNPEKIAGDFPKTVENVTFPAEFYPADWVCP
jgi:hypothetical protein